MAVITGEKEFFKGVAPNLATMSIGGRTKATILGSVPGR